MIRFHDSWLEDPTLRDWLVRVSNDETKAYCRCCSIVLRAHKADLTTHAGTVKHAKNTESAALAGVSVGPISVQIVPSEEQQVVSGSLNSMTRGPYTDGNNFTFQRSSNAKRFRPEWQEIDELKDWLEPCQEDLSKSYCKMCDVQLRSHKHDLLLHGRSSKHKRCSAAQAQAAMTATSTSTSNSNNVISVEYENELSDSDLVDNKLTVTTHYVPDQIESIVQSVVNEIPCKKSRVEVDLGEHTETTGGGIIHNEILPHNNATTVNHINGAGEEEDPMADVKPQQISIIRVMDKPKNTSTVYAQETYRSHGGTLRRRRGRMNAADVIRAVELNEFTGFELLQILKTIVPKL